MQLNDEICHKLRVKLLVKILVLGTNALVSETITDTRMAYYQVNWLHNASMVQLIHLMVVHAPISDGIVL